MADFESPETFVSVVKDDPSFMFRAVGPMDHVGFYLLDSSEEIDRLEAMLADNDPDTTLRGEI